ncbi:MAG TPA: Lrp/AsnC family transcriptional regulator [Dehalococcoidia bacterium]|nr:Lrp/AsnC family transcriptional regulator [Dehalococcoidia bacterium]
MLKDILKILENDARTTAKQIASMTGKSADEVTKLIKKAEKEQTIIKYKTIVNWEKVGDEQVGALIEVRIAPQRDVGFDAIAERIYRFPQARSVYLLSGTYDLLVLVAGKTMHEVAGFVSQKLAPIEGVQGTVTHFMLKRYKEDGEILGGEEGTKRQPVIL